MQYESEPRLVTLAGPLRPRPDESRPIWRGDCYAMPVSPTNNAPYDSALAVIRGALSSANVDAKGQANLRTSLNQRKEKMKKDKTIGTLPSLMSASAEAVPAIFKGMEPGPGEQQVLSTWASKALSNNLNEAASMNAVVAAASMRTHSLMDSRAAQAPLDKDTRAHLDNLVVETAAVMHRLKETDPKQVYKTLGEMRRNNALAAILADELLATAQSRASNSMSAEFSAMPSLEAPPPQKKWTWRMLGGWFAKKETTAAEEQEQEQEQDAEDAFSVADSDETRSESNVDQADCEEGDGFKPLELMHAFFHRNAREPEPEYETEFTYGSECGYAPSVTTSMGSTYELPPARVLPAITIEAGKDYLPQLQNTNSDMTSTSGKRMDRETQQRVEQYLTSAARAQEPKVINVQPPSETVEIRYRSILVPRVKYEPVEVGGDYEPLLPTQGMLANGQPMPTPTKLFDDVSEKSLFNSGDSHRDSDQSLASTAGQGSFM